MKLLVGKVLKAQGIKGELKVSCELDTPRLLLGVKKLYLQNNPHAVVKLRVDGSFFYVLLDGIGDRNTAENYKGWNIYCEKTDLHLQDGRYFIEDIVGCFVSLENGTQVGKVAEVLQYGSADVYVCEYEKDGRIAEVSFPALKDLVISINVDTRQIVLNSQRFAEVAVYDED